MAQFILDITFLTLSKYLFFLFLFALLVPTGCFLLVHYSILHYKMNNKKLQKSHLLVHTYILPTP
jgi:hypothetical protein